MEFIVRTSAPPSPESADSYRYVLQSLLINAPQAYWTSFTYACPSATPVAVGPVWNQDVKTPNREMCPIWHPSGVSFLGLVHCSPGCRTGNGDPGSARKLSRSGEVLEKFSIFIVCLWGVCRWTSLWLQGWKENARKWLKILKYVSKQTGCYW